jgi:hypothetical protein
MPENRRRLRLAVGLVLALALGAGRPGPTVAAPSKFRIVGGGYGHGIA